MKYYTTLLLLFLILSSQVSSAQEGEIVNVNFLLGAKVGIPYGLGISMGMITKNERKYNFYLDASIQSSIFLSTGNVGGGYVLTKNGFAVGLRYSRFAHSNFNTDDDRGNILFPELNWFIKVGKKKQTLMDLQLGPVGLNVGFSLIF